MLASVLLTSCSKKDTETVKSEIIDEASESTVTLSMYLMSESEVSEDKVEELEKAVNKITKSKFKTKIELRYFTEAEYNAALDEAFKATEDAREAKKQAEAALKEAIKKGEATTAASTEATEEETIVNEYGVPELKYPSIEDYQVDIFYLGGYDKFAEYLQNTWLSRLDEELSSTSKLLNDYVTPEFIKYMKDVKGGTYAIPNNTVVGEYTFMLLHKDALASWHYSADDSFDMLTSENTQDLLDKVSRFQADTYLPLKSFTGELDIANVKYFGLDENGNRTDAFSVMGGTYSSSFKYKEKNNYYPSQNIFADVGFREQMQVLAGYKEKGYYGTDANSDKPFAVGYIKGNYMDIEEYLEDYEIVVVEEPVINTMDLFENMFAVGAYTRSVSKSMQIITYLNTNVDFRNLILYGIEGTDYDIVEKEVDGKTYKTVKKIGDAYNMSLEKTGNTFIAYPLDTERADIRNFQIKQNQDIEVALDMGFLLDYVSSPINTMAMGKVRELSEKTYAELMEIDSVEEWSIYLSGNDNTKNVAYMVFSDIEVAKTAISQFSAVEEKSLEEFKNIATSLSADTHYENDKYFEGSVGFDALDEWLFSADTVAGACTAEPIVAEGGSYVVAYYVGAGEPIEGMQKTVMNNEYAKIMRNSNYNEEDRTYDPDKYGEGVSFYYIYFKWLSETKIYVPEFT